MSDKNDCKLATIASRRSSSLYRSAVRVFCFRVSVRFQCQEVRWSEEAGVSLSLQPSDILGQRGSGIELNRKVGIERTAAGQPNLSAGVYMIHSHPSA